MTTTLPPHVVIVGCGYAGGLLARNLDPAVKAGKIRLTIVDRRSMMHHKIGSIRASVLGGEWAERIEIPINRISKYAKCVFGEIDHIDSEKNTVCFKGTALDPISFDVLVCATGALNHSPGDLPEQIVTPAQVREYFKQVSSAFSRAKDIIIVGGGASAVEYAGEIRSRFPKTKIKIICSSHNLLGSSVAPVSSGFLKALYKKLAELDITLIRGEKVIKPTELDFGSKKFEENLTIQTVGTQNLTLKTDLLLWAASWAVEAEIYPQTWLNEIGELNITDTFQLVEREDVFAIGDVCSLSETKQAVTLPGKMKLIAFNVLAVAQAKRSGKPTSLRKYTVSDTATMYLPIGPTHGVSQYRGFVFGDAMTSKWKGKDLYTGMFWNLLSGEAGPKTPPLQ